MTNSSCDCGWDTCSTGTLTEKDEAKDPASSVGTLHKVNGTLLSHIPLPEGTDTFTIDKIPVRATILKCGKLQLTSLVPTDTKKESIDTARRAHRGKIAEVRDALERISVEKTEAEERYCDSLVASDDDDDGAQPGQEQAMLVMKLLAKRNKAAQKLEKLENTKELKVEFTTQGSVAVSLQPGIITVVPFSTCPIVWCPKSLAKLMPVDDKVDVVTVKVLGQPQLETPSEILSEDMLNHLQQMMPPNDDTEMVLHKLHDQNKGATAASYDQAVRPHGNVLIVIQANTGRVFGGFYVEPMGTGSGWHGGHVDDFLFSLGSVDQDPRLPTKLLKRKGMSSPTSHAIHRGCGLHMGEGNDLVAFCSSSTVVPVLFTVPAEGYPSLPPGESIAGTPGVYTPMKMEVYHLRAPSQE